MAAFLTTKKINFRSMCNAKLSHLNVTNFVSQTRNSPRLTRFINRINDANIQRFTFPKYLIQRHFAQFRSHCRLCKLCDRKFGIFDTIRSLKKKFRIISSSIPIDRTEHTQVRIQYSQIQNTIDAQCYVI